ncbi:MAG: Hydroxyacylglutathione hydrolase [Firmicutes bacterium ADurb.BinA205]|nr:MAG: Hydroxyacylglutathione hydrolase [Firmicutes bacterium ADurb.BinA205]
MKIINSTTRPINNIHYICMHIGGSPVTCYVINGKDGSLLIDTGFYFCCDRLREWLSQFNIRHILLTHAHVDHDFNAAKLRKSTGAQILLSEKDVPLIGNYRSQPVKATMRKYRLRNVQQNVCGGMKLFSTRPYSPDIVIKPQDSGILRSLGYDADIVPLPGHTLGSVGVLADGVLYCGDAFTAIWGRPDITPHAASLKAMRHSLKRILKISPQWLATGHGLPVSMDKARPVIINYLSERSLI